MSSNSFAIAAGAGVKGAVAPLPSFFIVGPPRTGTSWLHSVLRKSARLSDPTKETRFFDKHFERGLGWYGSHYRKVGDGRAIGEVAPTYFASPEARERIAQLIPHAKIVCTFRNPVDRVLSLYRLKRAYGLIPWDFDEALARDPELMESSRYAGHLKEWQRSFRPDQVMVTVHDDIQADPQLYLNKLVDFVGVPRINLRPRQAHPVFTSEDMSEPRNYRFTRAGFRLAEWAKARKLDSLVTTAKRFGALKLFIGGGPAFAELTSAQREKLRALFRPEVDELESMLNRSLAAWK